MLSFLSFWLEGAPLEDESAKRDWVARFFKCLKNRSKFMFGFSVFHLLYFQVPSAPGPTTYPVTGHVACCVVAKFLGVLRVQILVLVRLVRDRQTVHHVHEDDAVRIRLRVHSTKPRSSRVNET